MRSQPQQTTPRKTKRQTDTSPYVGHRCSICGEPVAVSKDNGFWRRNAQGDLLEAAHTTCRFPIRRSV